ncbi:hypothetical protein APSETT444_009312 [Aspergillus pseudonomiae]
MRVISQSVVPRDITDEFTKAASKLQTGQLVKDEYFTLFEAVGALEIMDSKMDSGYLGPGQTDVQALEDDYDTTRELAPEQVIGIMDELLCHEEEDFVTQLYNRSLLSQFDHEYFRNLLDRAISWVDEQGDSVDGKLKEAIKCRLVFRRDFLLSLNQDLDIIQSRSASRFSSCLSQLGPITESVPLGRPVPEAFSWKIQRKLASTVPPRPMVKISFEDALAHLKRLCQDAIDLLEVLDYSGPHNLKVAVWTLLSRKPQPSVYIRSLVQSMILSNMMVLGAVPVKKFLYDELAEIVLPSSTLLQANTDETEMPTDPRFQIANHMDAFVKRFAQAEDLDEQLRTLNNEPPLMLQNGDATYSYPLSSWAYHQKLNQFRLVIQLGFELSIYSPEELPGMYWYLSHICSTHLGHIDRIRTFTVATAKRNLTALAGKKRDAVERHAALQNTLRLLERLTTQIVAVDAFAISLHALYVLLARHGVLPTAAAAQAYSSERLRYELRMKPFLSITLPELVPFDEFRREAILEGDSDETVLERATKAISEARKAWEATLANGAFIRDPQGQANQTLAIEEDWKKDIKNTMRACIGASIAIETVKKALTALRASTDVVNLQVSIPDMGSKARWHDWWVVPQITPRPSGSQT